MIWEAPVQTTSWVGGLSQSQPSATLWADRISAPLPCGSPGLPGSPFGLSSRDGITATSSIACGAGVRSRRAAFVDHARRRRTERDGRRREPARPRPRSAHGNRALSARLARPGSYLRGQGLRRFRARSTGPDRRCRRRAAATTVQAAFGRGLWLLRLALPAADLAHAEGG